MIYGGCNSETGFVRGVWEAAWDRCLGCDAAQEISYCHFCIYLCKPSLRLNTLLQSVLTK